MKYEGFSIIEFDRFHVFRVYAFFYIDTGFSRFSVNFEDISQSKIQTCRSELLGDIVISEQGSKSDFSTFESFLNFCITEYHVGRGKKIKKIRL